MSLCHSSTSAGAGMSGSRSNSHSVDWRLDLEWLAEQVVVLLDRSGKVRQEAHHPEPVHDSKYGRNP